MNLDARQASIAQALLASKGAISASLLARSLGLSPRVIRYNLPAVRCWLGSRGAGLTIGPRRGVLLTAADEVRRVLKAELRATLADARPTGSDRVFLLLLDLLTSAEHQSGPSLASRLGSSRATLSRDLVQAQAWLSLHGLALSSRPRLGTIVQGPEINRRHALISLLFDLGLDSSLLELCLWRERSASIELEHPTAAQAAALTLVDTWRLQDAWRHVGEAAAGLDSSYAEMDHLFLALYWAIMLVRNRQGYAVAPPEDSEGLAGLPETQAVATAARNLEQETGHRLSKQELAQLALEFNTTSRESEPYGEGTTDRVALRVAEELVRQIGLRMGHGLADPAVPPRIACHLTRVFARLRHRLPIRNPLTDDVRQSFPELWRATAEAVARLQDELEISLPPQEIAFLTLYLALAFRIKHGLAEQKRRRVLIACPSGGVTVSILRSRLQAEFPDVEIVGVTSLKHLGKLDLSSVDALITTAPVRARGTPVIVVSPLLPETNIARIRDVFGMSRAVPAEHG